MRGILIACLLMVFLTSIASAELLTTANPLGKGKWAVLGAGLQDSNVGNIKSDFTMMTYGGYVGYGITDALDAYLQLGSVTSSTLKMPTGIPGYDSNTDVTGTLIGINLKYAVLDETKNMPVSVAVGLGYRTASMTNKTTITPTPPPPYPAETKTNGNGTQMMLGVGVSKIIVPFIPYGAIAYRTNQEDNQDAGTQLDITVGSGIAWSKQGAVFVEYTSQSISPKAPATNYTSGQIALGVGYII